VILTDSSSFARATSIAVSVNDVYVAGAEYNNTTGVAEYWKNGSPVILASSAFGASAYSIAVSGNDVYVTGTESTNGICCGATYWKNGSLVNLSGGSANGIFLTKQ
jgi:hypothetical protein